ncbi:MAG TPA: hypothetical protein VEJ89_09410, partial [Myxococcaceae bacterium]|nr:hypothetical protein [Myxococcaceae bacterium]
MTVAEVVSPPTVVDSSGGQVCTPGGVCVDIPAGALTQATTITISEAVAPAPVGVSPLTPLHRFQPEGTVFYVPVTVSIPVPTSTTAASLAWTKRGFVDYGAATTSDLDTLDGTVSGGKVSARVLHFSGGAATAPAPTRTVF